MFKEWIYSKDNKNLGLLLLRVGIGIAFMAHGFPKLFMGGAAGLAKGLAAAGIPGGVFAAYLAGIVEFFGGMALALGLFFRPLMVVMAFNMLVALIFHLNLGDPYVKYSHPLESGILFIALIFVGPGKFSLDEKLFGPAPEFAECKPMELKEQPV
jgi:putative oxidoreductase